MMVTVGSTSFTGRGYIMTTPVSSTSIAGRGHGQTTEVYLYNISMSLTGRGHDGHGQFNICHKTWS